MPVFVDSANIRYGRMIMCHMVADTPEELHAMAERIGVARKWFQRKASFPHYDICGAMKAKAIASGATELDRRGMYDFMKDRRKDRAYYESFGMERRKPISEIIAAFEAKQTAANETEAG